MNRGSRRRRHVLQVSTFPFLAVLLCAMGSLILLLLVIDRRARVVALAKARQAAEQSAQKIAAEDAHTAAARAAELERRRQAVHAQLLLQDQELLGQMQALQAQSAATVQNIQQEQEHARALESRLKTGVAFLSRKQSDLLARKEEISKRTQLTEQARGELIRLSLELEQLERTLAQMKALRQRQQHLYSVVPYRGRHGDNRRPLYLECAATGLIFHPDRLLVLGFLTSEIRAEVERRLARRQGDANPGAPVHAQSPGDATLELSSATTDKENKKPYLLMLIRPDGVRTYSMVLEALDGLDVDFGYELIDSDWALDFPADDAAPSKQPWMTAQPTVPQPPAARPSSMPQGLAGVSSKPAGVAFGQESGGRSQESAVSGQRSAVSGQRSAVRDVSRDAESAERSAGQSGVRNQGPGVPAVSRDAESSERSAGSQGSGVRNQGPGVPAVSRDAESSERSAGQPGVRGHASGVPAVSRDAGSSERSAGQAGVRSQGSGVPAVSRDAESSERSAGQPGVRSQGSEVGQRPAVNPTTRSFAPGGSGTSSPSHLLPPVREGASEGAASQARRPLAPVQDGVPNANVNLRESGEAPVPRPRGYSNGNEAVRSPEEADRDPYGRVTTTVLPEKPKQPPPVRPGWMSANRDWKIDIECTDKGVTIAYTRQNIKMEQLSGGADNVLAKSVRQLVERRQAMVPPEQLPWRPILRFQVRPEGQRVYYLAYPALQALHLPMMREDVE